MAGLESIALAAFCCLGGLLLLIAAPIILPILANLLGFAAELFGSCLDLLVGGPVSCCCSCLLVALLGIAVVAVGLLALNAVCNTSPSELCTLLGR